VFLKIIVKNFRIFFQASTDAFSHVQTGIMTIQYKKTVETWRSILEAIAAMNRRVRMVGRQLRCYRLIRARPCENKAVRRHTPLTSTRRRPSLDRPSALPNVTEMRDKLTRNRRVEAGDVRLADVLRLSRFPFVTLILLFEPTLSILSEYMITYQYRLYRWHRNELSDCHIE